jgi:Flp pilus assembly protein TadB
VAWCCGPSARFTRRGLRRLGFGNCILVSILVTVTVVVVVVVVAVFVVVIIIVVVVVSGGLCQAPRTARARRRARVR